MSSVTRVSRRLSPGSLLLISLVAILAVSLVLGYHALTTTRSHRASVESALRDYASMAAWEYSSVVREDLNTVLRMVFDEVTREWRGYGELPALRTVAEELRDVAREYRCECEDLRNPLSFFRIDLQDSTTISLSDTLAAGILSWLADTVMRHQQEHADERAGLVMLPAGSLLDSPTLVTYSTTYVRRRNARALYGFVTNPSAYGELLAKWFAAQPLLPPAVTGTHRNDSLLYITVHTGSNDTLFESGARYPTTYTARDTMEAEYGGLIVAAAIRPDIADHLIIGGLPGSRLPLIVALLLITLGLGAAALYQLRRERQLARLRDDFVSGVSHELRTPLAQVRMFAELLDSGKLRTQEERDRSLGVINREARRLTQLVENILQFSRSARAAVDLKIERLDVARTVSEVIEAFRPLALARTVSLESEIQDGLGLRADRDAVSQVLLNLLDNAVKYGPDGQTVTVRASRAGNGLRLSVEDEGPGIPRTERRRIWEPYQRLRRDGQRAVTGTGIGLAVVDELVALHDGRAWVDDAATGGARFVVELPGATSSSGANHRRASEEGT
jgi:signal transduction histidine kinase